MLRGPSVNRHLRHLGRKRVRRFTVRMGLPAAYQKPRTTAPHPEHREYLCVLRDLMIDQINQVWCFDITYIPMHKGVFYLLAIKDGLARKARSWRPALSICGDH
ncbi:hypothetical protein S101446_03272 (plasmid) [Komagataeibacter europaeus]|nr:hypothetical protein S101446_03272 [Komagataeibacter europaeus]